MRKPLLKCLRAAVYAALFTSTSIILSSCNDQESSQVDPIIKRNLSSETNNNPDQEVKDTNSTPSIKLLLSDQFEYENSTAKSSFNCDQKVFAVIELHNYPKATHNITVNWLDPHDKQRESTQIPTYPVNAITYTWASLSLHRDVTAGMLQWINPAAGMEEFIGEWKVNVLIDGKLEKTKQFTVVC